MKVEVISDYNEIDFENRINYFLETNLNIQLIDIKLSQSQGNDIIVITALIMYEEI